jgi:hypothetical protein
MATERASSAVNDSGTLRALVEGAHVAAQTMRANEADTLRWAAWGHVVDALDTALAALALIYSDERNGGTTDGR